TIRSWVTTTGLTGSATVTVAVQVELLPLLSVTVKVTGFVPTLVQSKLLWFRLRLAMPQASVLPLLICAGSIVPWPLASNSTLRFWQTASGGTESTTVTVAVQVELLPLLSVTVRVTRFVPMLLQSKLVWLRLRLAMPQASVLPLLSVTVRVTVLVPTLLTTMLVLSRLRLAMPQASVLPLLIWAGVMVACPFAFNSTVRSWQTATGGTVSTTVTVAGALWLLPLLSVTVRVTLFAPRLPQSK